MTSVPPVSAPSGSRESQRVPCSTPNTTASAWRGGDGEGDHQAGRRGGGAGGRRRRPLVGRVDRRGGALHLGDQHVVQDGVRLPASRPERQRDEDADGVAGREPAADRALRLEQDADLLQARRARRPCRAPAGRPGRANRPASSCSPGRMSTVGDPAGQRGEVGDPARRRPSSPAPSRCARGRPAGRPACPRGSARRPRGRRRCGRRPGRGRPRRARRPAGPPCRRRAGGGPRGRPGVDASRFGAPYRMSRRMEAPSCGASGL